MKSTVELRVNDTFNEEDTQKYNAFTILKTSIAALNTSMKIMVEKCEKFRRVEAEGGIS